MLVSCGHQLILCQRGGSREALAQRVKEDMVASGDL